MYRKQKITLFIVIFIILVGSIIYNYSQIRQYNKPQFSEEICQELQVYISQTSKKVENYHNENGRYPENLQLFGIYDDQLDYLVEDDAYQLTFTWGDHQIAYQSQYWDSPEDFMTEECIYVMGEKIK